MLNILLIGPPGAGKGTQSNKLIEKYGLVHLSTGEILRCEIAKGSSMGLLAKTFIDRGELVPDKLVIDMIAAKLDEHAGVNGFIFDGFPRNCDQALALDNLLKEKKTSLTHMIALDVDYDELINRLELRSRKEGRSDDTREVIENRIKLYKEFTEPVIEYYKERKKFKSVNGKGDIDEIFDRIVSVFEEVHH